MFPGFLKMDQVKVVFIDWTWKDKKMRRIVDIPETRSDMFLFIKGFVCPRLRSRESRIDLF